MEGEEPEKEVGVDFHLEHLTSHKMCTREVHKDPTHMMGWGMAPCSRMRTKSPTPLCGWHVVASG